MYNLFTVVKNRQMDIEKKFIKKLFSMEYQNLILKRKMGKSYYLSLTVRKKTLQIVHQQMNLENALCRKMLHNYTLNGNL